MLILKRDLPFAKKGSEAHRKYKKDVTSDDYDWYVRDDNRILHWIGDSTMDMSDWIEEVPEKLRSTKTPMEFVEGFEREIQNETISNELDKHTAKIVELFEKQQKEIEFIKKNLTQRILYDKENSTYDKSAYALLDNIESQIERLESLQDKQHDNLIEKIENLKCYKKK